MATVTTRTSWTLNNSTVKISVFDAWKEIGEEGKKITKTKMLGEKEYDLQKHLPELPKDFFSRIEGELMFHGLKQKGNDESNTDKGVARFEKICSICDRLLIEKQFNEKRTVGMPANKLEDFVNAIIGMVTVKIGKSKTPEDFMQINWKAFRESLNKTCSVLTALKAKERKAKEQEIGKMFNDMGIEDIIDAYPAK